MNLLKKEIELSGSDIIITALANRDIREGKGTNSNTHMSVSQAE